jgi:RNA polymerase sigma-70 factor (ECF subfamily)
MSMMSAERDRDLARRMLAGDESAFEQFFQRHFPSLYRFALTRLGGDEDAAEEAAQMTLCKAIEKLGTYRGEASLFTWLCTFCRHEIAARYRRAGRTAPTIDLVEDLPGVRSALESMAATLCEEPERSLERKELGRLVHVALDSMPAHYGDALEWKYIDEIPVVEIAVRLGVSPKAAESILTRAREAFREVFSSLTRSSGLGPPRNDSRGVTA